MPELRKDPLLSRWVIIATERAKRPEDFKHPPHNFEQSDQCPFCRGKESLTPLQHYVYNDSRGDWRVRVVTMKNPFLELEGDFWKKGKGPYDLMNGFGHHELIIETPEHVANMADLDQGLIRDVFFTYCQRTEDLQKDPRIKSVLIFKNYGSEAGGGKFAHSRSQIIATPVNLKRVKEELEGTKRYFEYHERCVFCDTLRQELSAGDRIVLDEDGFVALVPFASRFPYEVWVLPKKHGADFYKMSNEQLEGLSKVMKKVLSKLKNILGDPAYNYVIHTAPFRRDYPGYWSTLDEDFHWHIEITPRLTRVAGFEWGTGFYICPAMPEDSAKYLREA